MDKKTIEIPFRAKDSELYKFEYTIPKGYEAEIKDGKIIVTKKESEDERIRKAISYAICTAAHQDGTLINDVTKDEALAYLEKQKEQKPAEWSEEDKDYYDAIIAKLEVVQDDALLTDNQIDFLKSLRPQPHWKPSAEQMRAVFAASERNDKLGAILNNLYNDLKKL